MRDIPDIVQVDRGDSWLSFHGIEMLASKSQVLEQVTLKQALTYMVSEQGSTSMYLDAWLDTVDWGSKINIRCFGTMWRSQSTKRASHVSKTHCRYRQVISVIAIRRHLVQVCAIYLSASHWCRS